MEILTAGKVSFQFIEDGPMILDGVSFSVADGEFLVVCGPVGSGKSTLLRHFKPELMPYGPRSGRVLFRGQPMQDLSPAYSAEKIGFVLQDPDGQIVTDTVWHELAFGLENLGLAPDVIRLRVAEMASFFGIAPWFRRSCAELSSGQKQIVALASVLVMQPDLLILDEPTAQLDPIAAGEFLQYLQRVHQELGITIVLAEQRLEDVFPLADRVALLDGGCLIGVAAPSEMGAANLTGILKRMEGGLPVAMRMALAAAPNETDRLPVTLQDGRSWLSHHGAEPATLKQTVSEKTGDEVLAAKELWFRYRREDPDVLRGLSLQLRAGEIHAVLGANGSGKSTLLSLLAGLDAPQRGKVRSNGGRMVLLGADPRALLIHDTVRDAFLHLSGEPEQDPLGIGPLLDRNPLDLSSGERQKAALALALSRKPDILLLDEPTRGLDPETRILLRTLLQDLTTTGTAILLVTHDVSFAAETADRCSLLFDGEIVSSAPPGPFFSGNRFYTTPVNRMTRFYADGIVTVSDLLTVMGIRS